MVYEGKLNKSSGYTLIEMIIVVAIMGFIMAGVSEVLATAIRVYNINMNYVEPIGKLEKFLHRIDIVLNDTKSDATGENIITSEIVGILKTGSLITGVQIRDIDSISYWYWYNSNDGNIYRSGETGSITPGDDIVLFRSGTATDSINVAIDSFEYTFYEKNNGNLVEIDTGLSSAILLVIDIKIKGTDSRDGANLISRFERTIKIP